MTAAIKRLPTYFISHGGPNMILDKKHPTVQFLSSLGKALLKERPKGVLMVSAHWESKDFSVTTHPEPETIYDFYGFEDEMYTLKYPAKTSAELSSRVCDLLKAGSITCNKDEKRGFDHGCWTPLKMMFPEADIPVVQLSLKKTLNAAEHIKMANALKDLRNEGYLIIGSGGATHNLGALSFENVRYSWATDFDSWLEESLTKHSTEDREKLLSNFESQKSARQAHPHTEHFIPLLIPATLGGKAKKIHDNWQMGLSLAAYEFE